jgi:transposase-like protein
MTRHGLSLIFEDRSRTVNMARRTETVEVITTDQRRRRWSVQEKATLVRRTYEPGMSVSLVARQEGVAASLLFQWRRL